MSKLLIVVSFSSFAFPKIWPTLKKIPPKKKVGAVWGGGGNKGNSRPTKLRVYSIAPAHRNQQTLIPANFLFEQKSLFDRCKLCIAS